MLRAFTSLTSNKVAHLLLLGLFMLFSVMEARAAITYVSRMKGDVRNSGTLITVPLTLDKGNIVANDYILVQLTLASASACNVGFITAPGWTLLNCTTTTGGVIHSQALFGKVAVASDNKKKYIWKTTSSVGYLASAWVFRGVDPSNPIDTGPVSATYSNVQSAVAPDITTVTPSAMGVVMITADVDSDKTFTPPSGWTEARERRCGGHPSGCKLELSMSYKLLPTAGLISSVTTTLKTNQYGVVSILALRPFSLIAYYPFDGANWLADNSGNALHATANGTATPSVAKICTGFSANGVSWLTVANNSNQSFSSAYAITTWINPASLPTSGTRAIISKETNSTSGINYDLSINAAGKLVWGWNESGGTLRSLTSAASIPLNQWTHIGVVFDKSLGSLQQKMYINGAMNASSSINAFAAITTASLYIGSSIGLTSGASNRNFIGLIDEVRLYNAAIPSLQVTTDMNANHPCGVDHYALSIDGLGLTCLPELVAVTACANTDCSVYYEGLSDVTLTTSSGTLSPSTVSFIGGLGLSDLSKSTIGDAAINISAATPVATASPTCILGGLSVPMSACKINFFNDRFTLDVPDLTACLDNADASIQAESCGTVITGTKNVSFWSAYSSPNTGTKIPKINGTTISTTSPGIIKSLVFDVDGLAPFTINYADAGQVILNANIVIGGATISGNGSFISAPEKLLLYSTDPNAACTPSSSTCSAFARAGQGFPLKIKAACYSTLTDPVAILETPNFMLAGIPLTIDPVAPTPNNPVVLGVTSASLNAADQGIATINQNISEVGVFQITATPPNYFDIELPISTSANIGRFIPDHFDTVVSEGACTDGFTYSGQPFIVSLTARNAASEVTLNYDHSIDFAKNITLSATGATGTISNGDAGIGSKFLASHFANGETSLTPLNPAFSFTTSPSAPALINLRATDTDGVSSAGYTEGSLQIRSGRLKLQNAYGSELLPLSIPLEAQYWNGTSYIRNQQDSCTILPASSITMANYKNNLAACETQIGYSSGSGAFVSGVSKYLRLTKSGASNNGSVDLTLNLNSASGNTCNTATPSSATAANIPWFGVNPISRATFGIFKTPIIYMRENF